jgi:ribosomal protein S6--L-glutamate ligase
MVIYRQKTGLTLTDSTAMHNTSLVAIGYQLAGCRHITTVGVKRNWNDYSLSEQNLITNAHKIYFPTIFFASPLYSAGKNIFPSINSYNHLGDKIRQLTLFSITNIPIPKTRIFSQAVTVEEILDIFSLPLVAKLPYGSGRGQGVFLIRSKEELKTYLSTATRPYIQEYLPIHRDIRVVVVGQKVILAYWKQMRKGNFRSNVAQGGAIDFRDVPDAAVDLALDTAIRCGLDHAGFDIAEGRNGFVVLEANVNFGKEGFEMAGLSYKQILCNMIDRGEI